MDAKPQKPLRGFRVLGDENAVPVNAGGKTLHSRNKSSPALSTMAAKSAAQQQQPPIKRTAFGDVSNIANGKRAARDDMALSGKVGNASKETIASFLPDKKAPAPLARPAQRPMSLSTGLKGLLNNNNALNPAHTSKQSDGNSQPVSISTASSIVANLKKVAARRNTVSSKETLAPSASSIEDLKLPKQESNAQPEVRSKPQQSMQPIPESSILPVVITAKGEDYVQPQPLPSALPSAYDLYQKAISQVELPSVHQPSEKQEIIEAVNKENVAANVPPQTLSTALHDNNSDARVAKETSSHVLPAVASELEEVWDDVEDDEEHIDDDGYVTARSFKSRQDNVTGNATTIIVPHMNARVRKELAVAKEIVEGSRTPEDIEDDNWDSTMVAEYSDEIFEYMRDLEIRLQPNPHYMDHQTEIQWSMRSVLMDWLVQVHARFQLLPETLFLCVNYIDRFLSCKVVSLGKLQLVGATAIFVAAKYEEINCPSVAEIVYMVDHGYTIEEILKAERFMLGMLQFEMGWPGPMSFLRRISKADDYDLETRTLAKYFLEVTIMDERFLGCPPSFAAAGAHCLARLMLKKGNWSHSHVYYSNYTYGQLYSLVQLILECCDNPAKHHAAVYEKYLDKRYKCASHFVRKELERGFRLMDVGTNEQAFMNFYAQPLPAWSVPQMPLK